jgi:hypothetical protein
MRTEAATRSTACGAASYSASVPSNRSLARLTCAQYASDTDFGSPAYTGDVTTNPCEIGAPMNSKRITVIMPSSSATRALPPVVLETWITSVPGGM